MHHGGHEKRENTLSGVQVRPFYLKNSRDGRTRFGCAVGHLGQAQDIYMWPGHDTDQNIKHMLPVLVPSLLGVLQLNQLDCGPVVPERGDNAASLQAISVAALDTYIQKKGLGGSQHGKVQAFQQFAGKDSTAGILHKVHHEEDDQAWQTRVRAQLAQLGGMGQLQYTRMPEQELTDGKLGQLTWVRERYEPDTSQQNLLVVQGFTNEVKPRLEATGMRAEDLGRRILTLAEEGAPETAAQQLSKAAGMAGGFSVQVKKDLR